MISLKIKHNRWSFQAPLTSNRELANTLKAKLEKFSNQKILIQEKLGQTVCSSLAKANPNPSSTCHRTDCKMCLVKPSNGNCYRNNVGYRILCNRQPCTKNINTRKIDNRQMRQQLEKLKPIQTESDRPAIYEGETFR